jgi:hypothetical protein
MHPPSLTSTASATSSGLKRLDHCQYITATNAGNYDHNTAPDLASCIEYMSSKAGHSLTLLRGGQHQCCLGQVIGCSSFERTWILDRFIRRSSFGREAAKESSLHFPMFQPFEETSWLPKVLYNILYQAGVAGCKMSVVMPSFCSLFLPSFLHFQLLTFDFLLKWL